MSCRQTQPDVLWRGVQFRHGSLFCVNSLSAARALCEKESRRMLPHFLLISSIYCCLIRFWPVWRKPHQYKPDQPGICDHVNLKTFVQFLDCIVFKSLNGLAPPYLADLLKRHTPTRSLRSSDQLLLTVPRSRLKLRGNRAFSVVAPRLWNSLSLYVRAF